MYTSDLSERKCTSVEEGKSFVFLLATTPDASVSHVRKAPLAVQQKTFFAITRNEGFIDRLGAHKAALAGPIVVQGENPSFEKPILCRIFAQSVRVAHVNIGFENLGS